MHSGTHNWLITDYIFVVSSKRVTDSQLFLNDQIDSARSTEERANLDP